MKSVFVTLVVLFAFALLSFPAQPSIVAAQSPATTLSSSPATVDQTLDLGASGQVSITLNNSSSATLSAHLYEGRAANEVAGVLLNAAPKEARVPLPLQADRVDPQIAGELAGAGLTNMLVFLADQPDLSAAYTVPDWAERGRVVYQLLYAHAEQSQRGLRSLIASRGLRYTPLWITNAILVYDATAADVTALSGRAEVALLRADHVASLPLETPPVDDFPLDQVAACDADSANVCWNISRIEADQVWNRFGVRGEGIVVGSIDSGVSYSHPALIGQYRGNRGDGSFEHHYNWFDAYANSPEPVDSGNHGTHTMGTIVAAGTSSPAAPAVGVAPGARWIAARGCGVTSCSESDLIRAAQWMLAPTDLSGNSPRPDLRPQIINNSWSSGSGDNDWYAGYTAAWRAAGMFPVFAAGNTGATIGCSSIQSPGDYSDVVGVGSVDSQDRLSSFSSKGPTVDGRLKPDLTAPGSNVLSTVSFGTASYSTLSGTSMATPHVVGVAALLWSANPGLIGNFDATYAALTENAMPVTSDSRYEGSEYLDCAPGAAPNNLYGHGRLNAYASVAAVSVDVPWLQIDGSPMVSLASGGSEIIQLTLDAGKVPAPGIYQARVLVHGSDLTEAPLLIPVTLRVPVNPDHATVSGVVSSLDSGEPLAARVHVAGGAEVTTDSLGRYSLTLPAATQVYTLTARAFDYAPQSAGLTLSVGMSATLDFSLEADRPRLDAEPGPYAANVGFGETVDLPLQLSNSGTQALSYTLSLTNEPFGVWRSDMADGPETTWITPPANATTVALLDDTVSDPIDIGFAFPYFDGVYTSLQVAANGFISLKSLPVQGSNFAETCLPITETPGPAIVPLRADLNPARGGTVSYARISEGLLVTWQDVPFYSDNDRKVSFQALLQPNGRIRFNYDAVADIQESDFVSYGVQASNRNAQGIACRNDLGLSDGLRIELRPQADPSLWLEVAAPSGTIAPAATAAPKVQLRWTPATDGSPVSATLRIVSNDPQRPQQTITVRMTPEDAAHRLYFPVAPVN
ncbi:MAG: S8 family serine peptidase [Oscillochloris sp.]|nr:S8 family serine peptidase [Oscillochloris sp.]